MPSTKSFQPKPAAFSVRSTRAMISLVCASVLPSVSLVLPNRPDRYRRLPTFTALLRIGLGLPGEPSAAGVVKTCFGRLEAVSVISICYCGPFNGATNVELAGGSYVIQGVQS